MGVEGPFQLVIYHHVTEKSSPESFFLYTLCAQKKTVLKMSWIEQKKKRNPALLSFRLAISSMIMYIFIDQEANPRQYEQHHPINQASYQSWQGVHS